MSENKTEENQEDQVTEKPQLSPEEYAEARKKAMEHLSKEIEYLEVEAKYEKLVADVEEHKTRGVTAIATRAQFFARQQQAQAAAENGPGGQPQQPADQPPTANKPTRPLKKS
jgi:hypothetical protein